MSAVQNDTLKINHYVNRAAPVSIYRDWPASLDAAFSAVLVQNGSSLSKKTQWKLVEFYVSFLTNFQYTFYDQILRKSSIW